MNIEAYIDDLLEYFEDNLEDVVDAISAEKEDVVLPHPNKYILDYPDMMKHTNNVVFYILPGEFRFEYLSNESNEMVHTPEVYITFKGSKDTDLAKISKRYAEAMYRLVKSDITLGELVDMCIISEINFYDAIEGFANTKAIKMTLTINKEIN